MDSGLSEIPLQTEEKLLTTVEASAINTLKDRIPDLIQENEDFTYDFYLIHWLRVQNFNVNKAETMIRDAVKWKRENNIEKLVKEDFDPAIDSKLHVDLNGVTKEGYPINSANAGNFRVKEAIRDFGKDAVSRHWYQILGKTERLILDARRRMDRKYGSKAEYNLSYAKSWLVLNLTNLAYSEMLSLDVLSVLGSTFQITVKYFPIIAGTICCVNANRIFDIAFKIVAPILKGSNVSVYVFGTNQEKWKSFIFKYIDEDQLQLVLSGSEKTTKLVKS